MFLMMITICSASLMKFEKMLKFHDISKGPALSSFFYEISQFLRMGSNFTCMFLLMIPICSASLMKFDELWKNVEISWYFKGAGTVGIFLWNQSTSLNWLKFHMHVSDDDSNMFCKFDEIWWTLKKMSKFHDISKGRHCRHFSMK